MHSGIVIQNNRTSSNGHRTFELVESSTPQTDSSEHSYRPVEQHPLLSYWRVLKKRRWTIVATFAIVLVLAIIATLRMPRLYEAVSRIAIYPENSNVLGLKDLENGGMSEDWDYNVSLETQLSILRSDALALKVIEALHLDSNPRFMDFAPVADASRGIGSADLGLESRQIASMVSIFHSGLTVQVMPRTRVVELTYIHPDPQLAAEITNALVKTFVEENFRTK